MSADSQMLQFSPFVSVVDPSFWHKLTQLKLDVDKLNENVHEIWGYFSNRSTQSLNRTLTVDCSSFNENPEDGHLVAFGRIINKNTIETFKDEDKASLISEEGQMLMNIIKDQAIENVNLLSRFMLFTFADLKKYHYYYWFAFPALSFISYKVVDEPKNITNVLSNDQVTKICDLYNGLKTDKDKTFFMVDLENDVQLHSVQEGLSRLKSDGTWMLGFADPSLEEKNPGWPLRNYLAFVSYHCREVVRKPVRVLCLRLRLSEGQWRATSSIAFSVAVAVDEACWDQATWPTVGWERNERGKLGPRFANLSKYMDPARLAETSVDLNLKLMKWQLMPELNLDAVRDTKCLLLGAGTLGCVVARSLMAWGVRHITFVDYGKVSYSNPVRQSLYTFADSAKGGVTKAEAAAAALRAIFPGMTSEGVVLSIPMPGHPIGDSVMEETIKTVQRLEQLIDDHDVTFLLLDSRESRWLPTLVTAAKGKLCINAALGFDSYLVMRHGLRASAEATQSVDTSPRLGCYFCNDVTAPGNTGASRTLDQQCTVTRPGVSNMAGALAVELLASLRQHPEGGRAVAECDPDQRATASCLGIVPHSIRGFLSHFHTVLPATEAFGSCVACSDKVVNEYLARGVRFVIQALESKDYLEELTGLSSLHQDALLSEVIDYSSSDDSVG